MSPSSWKASLRSLRQKTADLRIAILGIGNSFRSDDAAGILVARALMESRLVRHPESVLVMDAGHAPENSTAELRRFAPGVVLLVDAAEMGEPPGTIRLIEMDEIDGMSASTHSLPLSMLSDYLVLELGCDVKLLGLQPKSNDVGEQVSAEVAEAVKQIVEHLQQIL